jgi:hypothetical protein
MGALTIRYYPSAEEQRELVRRVLRGRMYTFFAVIAASVVFDVLAAWWIVKAF